MSSISTRRVVVTGMAGVTSLGQSWPEIESNLRAGASGVQRMPDWERYSDLLTRLGAPVTNFTLPPHYTRKTTRTMGRVAQMAVRSSEVALEDAGLKDDTAFLRLGPRRGRLRIEHRQHRCDPRLRQHAHERRVGQHQCDYLHPHDGSHHGGQHRRVLRPAGPRHPDLERLHLG